MKFVELTNVRTGSSVYVNVEEIHNVARYSGAPESRTIIYYGPMNNCIVIAGTVEDFIIRISARTC